jgi:hypothetical protein
MKKQDEERKEKLLNDPFFFMEEYLPGVLRAGGKTKHSDFHRVLALALSKGSLKLGIKR